MNLKEYEALQPHVQLDGITFLTPNSHCAWRVDTLYTKEPDTIAWIQAMETGQWLWDIGSNMGQYALVAANRGITVDAFEPESQNFALLCRNIAVNHMGNRITPWNLALADEPGVEVLHVQGMMAGGSCHSYKDAVDYHLRPKEYAFRQGCFATTLDAFALKYGFPDHIKLDVDGIEHKILRGGAELVLERKSPLKSVLVELNTHLAEHQDIYRLMESHGFAPDTATADAARRKEGPFAGVGNVIFYRK